MRGILHSNLISDNYLYFLGTKWALKGIKNKKDSQVIYNKYLMSP